MTSFVRSLGVLLIAVFMAGTLVIPAFVGKAEAMTVMPMAPAGQDCAKCGSQADLAAGCGLICAFSVVAILGGPVMPAIAVTNCRLDIAEATATGQAPSPAFMPPRTTALI